MDLGIAGRVAVVTGADSGMGLATARLLAAEGVQVMMTDIDAEPLRKAAATLDGKVEICAADLTDAADATKLQLAVESRFGAADILVHSAGITGPTGDFLELTDEEWRRALEVDFMTAVRVCRAFIPGMKSKRFGRIVLFSSEDAQQPYVEELPYCAAKAAILNLSKGLSKAYGTHGVLVNTVLPAFIATPRTDVMMQKRAEQNGTSFDEAIDTFLAEQRPGIVARRRGEPDEVAAAVAYLCSASASFTTGASLRVDGVP